ncbi:exopolysaccharide production protein YjbE [Methylobacterium sp. WL120]|uniref:exopolysaccharide production protein YjbE n=1 Tax=Methylobacterium sp. WL120 TaxID=2603887 RepID=UPI0011CACEA1|nr:exopolysaccharide production protein YjbE [Methylobacterium sp. WL120]TXM64016.1 exopolysaccharide production protein YjbE [Methylobacterium sp. WL120]
MKSLSTAVTMLLLSGSVALAAPCTTDKSKSPNQATNTKSSDVDASSKNTAGGNQPASPGTVGAMNNVGSNSTAAAGQGSTSDKGQGKEDPAAKNMAGGNQPAAPGTVGAMNNAQPTQTASKDEGC